MDFLFINTHELSALAGLPHIQQLTYLIGIRPYMDRKTCIVGIKRKISYQSLSETLYVEPHQGIQSGSPSKQQLRRIINGLEQAGLVQIQSTSKHLILKCLLADLDNFAQNKPDTKPTSHSDPSFDNKNTEISTHYTDDLQNADRGENAKADIPHNSVNNYVCLSAYFEKFWESYPEPQNKTEAWNAFKKINPDETLFSKILGALQAQVEHYERSQAAGIWMPRWKYPANWLALCSWENELTTFNQQEKPHANHQKRAPKQPVDFFWESCKGGADYIPDCEPNFNNKPSTNVVRLNEYRKTTESH